VTDGPANFPIGKLAAGQAGTFRNRKVAAGHQHRNSDAGGGFGNLGSSESRPFPSPLRVERPRQGVSLWHGADAVHDGPQEVADRAVTLGHKLFMSSPGETTITAQIKIGPGGVLVPDGP
jgi:hypothetical protein